MDEKEQAIQFYLNIERANDAFEEFHEEYKGIDFGGLHEGLELANSGKLSRDEYIKMVTNLYKHIDRYHLKIETDYEHIGELYYKYKALDESNYKWLSTQDDKFIRKLKFSYAVLSRNYRLLSTAKEIINKYYEEVIPYEKWMQPSSLNTTPKGAPNKGNTDIRKCVYREDKSLIERLKRLTLGKRGKDFYLYIGVCIKHGLMCKPTFRQITAEFGDVGSRTGYDEYIRDYDYKYSDEEKIAVWEAITARN